MMDVSLRFYVSWLCLFFMVGYLMAWVHSLQKRIKALTELYYEVYSKMDDTAHELTISRTKIHALDMAYKNMDEKLKGLL